MLTKDDGNATKVALLKRDAESDACDGVASHNLSSSPRVDTASIVIIERRALNRECLARCLRATTGQSVLAFAMIEEWLQIRDTASPAIIVLGTAAGPRNAEVEKQLTQLIHLADREQIVVLSDVEDPEQIVHALKTGVRGYIPTSLSLDVATQAIHLVRAGGVFVPAGTLISARRAKYGSAEDRSFESNVLTERQIAVVKALRCGKPNKIIAYELNMSESTVKVHVRNIMRKLRAKNRTEVALMSNDLCEGEFA